jgi:hypothetical protein
VLAGGLRLNRGQRRIAAAICKVSKGTVEKVKRTLAEIVLA